MSKHVLLLEPYEAVAKILIDLLDRLGYLVDVETSGDFNENRPREKTYDCVFINLDQNRSIWRDHGLRLAAAASKRGIPVVMIPDHEIAAATIDAHGWLRIEKPFTLQNMERVIRQAVGATIPTSDVLPGDGDDGRNPVERTGP